MQIILALLMIVLLAAPAQAQRMGRHKQGSGAQSSEQHKKDGAAQAKAYRSALDRIPNQKPADPWGGMR